MSKQRSLFNESSHQNNESLPLPYRATKDGVELFVRATPKATKERIDGVSLDADGRAYLKIFVTAPAEDNQANKAIISLLAKRLSLPKACISLKSGGTHRLKCFALDGISLEEVAAIVNT